MSHVDVSARLMQSMEEHEAWNGMGDGEKPAVSAAQREWAALCRAAAKFRGVALTTEMSYILSFVSVVYKAVVLPKNLQTAFKHVQQYRGEYDSDSDEDGPGEFSHRSVDSSSRTPVSCHCCQPTTKRWRI